MLGLARGEVSLSAYDPLWPEIAQETIEQLKEVFGQNAAAIEHIGSTAIVGLSAKPIIDIAVGVRDFAELAGPLAEMLQRGFTRSNNRFSSDLLYVREHAAEGRTIRTHQIHILVHNSNQWHNYVDFRDYMNAHPERAKEYEALKQRLQAECRDIQTAYTDGKRDYMQRELALAHEWAKSRDKACANPMV